MSEAPKTLTAGWAEYVGPELLPGALDLAPLRPGDAVWIISADSCMATVERPLGDAMRPADQLPMVWLRRML